MSEQCVVVGWTLDATNAERTLTMPKVLANAGTEHRDKNCNVMNKNDKSWNNAIIILNQTTYSRCRNKFQCEIVFWKSLQLRNEMNRPQYTGIRIWTIDMQKKEKRKKSIRRHVDTRIPGQMTLVLCIQCLLLSLTLTVSQGVFEARNEGVITSWNSQFIAYPMLNFLPRSVPPMLDSIIHLCVMRIAHYLFIDSFILSLTHSSCIVFSMPSRTCIPTSTDLRIFWADVIICLIERLLLPFIRIYCHVSVLVTLFCLFNTIYQWQLPSVNCAMHNFAIQIGAFPIHWILNKKIANRFIRFFFPRQWRKWFVR